METWALHWPFTGVAGVGLPFYGFFKAWLEWRGCCLKFSVLLCCAIMVLWLKRESFAEDFCLFVLSADTDILGLSTCSAPNL